MLTVFNRRPFPIATSHRRKTADGNSRNLPISLYNDLHPSWTVCFLKQCRVAFTHSQSINPTNVDCGLTPCQEALCLGAQPNTAHTESACGVHVEFVCMPTKLAALESGENQHHGPCLSLARDPEGQRRKQLASDTGYIAQSRLNLGEQDPFIHKPPSPSPPMIEKTAGLDP